MCPSFLIFTLYFYGEDGEEHSEPLGLESALKGVHRAAEDVSVLLDFHSVFYCQQGLRVFRGHAEYACEPAPEHGTGTSEGDGRGHSHDVAGTDGGGQGCGQGAELAYVSVIGLVLGD